MKTTTIIQQYKKEPVIGTKTAKEVKSFFGTNLVDIEDEIVITDISIQYSDTPATDPNNPHYQYYDLTTLVTEQEVNTLRSLDDIKFENHTIDLYRQDYTNFDNLQWNFVLKARNILKEYLFARLKESRMMKSIRKNQTPKSDINTFIYDYIEYNLLDRYNINYITYYVSYKNVVDDGNTFNNNYTIKNPTFNKNSYKIENVVKDVRILTTDYLNNLGDVNMTYFQTKNSIQYTFDYYYVISYKKI
jgi:hypothetical protein